MHQKPAAWTSFPLTEGEPVRSVTFCFLCNLLHMHRSAVDLLLPKNLAEFGAFWDLELDGRLLTASLAASKTWKLMYPADSRILKLLLSNFPKGILTQDAATNGFHNVHCNLQQCNGPDLNLHDSSCTPFCENWHPVSAACILLQRIHVMNHASCVCAECMQQAEALGCRQPDSCGQSADSNRLCTNGWRKERTLFASLSVTSQARVPAPPTIDDVRARLLQPQRFWHDAVLHAPLLQCCLH